MFPSFFFPFTLSSTVVPLASAAWTFIASFVTSGESIFYLSPLSGKSGWEGGTGMTEKAQFEHR